MREQGGWPLYQNGASSSYANVLRPHLKSANIHIWQKQNAHLTTKKVHIWKQKKVHIWQPKKCTFEEKKKVHICQEKKVHIWKESAHLTTKKCTKKCHQVGEQAGRPVYQNNATKEFLFFRWTRSSFLLLIHYPWILILKFWPLNLGPWILILDAQWERSRMVSGSWLHQLTWRDSNFWQWRQAVSREVRERLTISSKLASTYQIRLL